MKQAKSYLDSLYADALAFCEEHSLSKATVKSYRLVIRSNFGPWCRIHGFDVEDGSQFDDDTVASYLVDRRDYPEVFAAVGLTRKAAKSKTLGVELAAIEWHFRMKGGTSPVGAYSRLVLEGMRASDQSDTPAPNVQPMTADLAEEVARLEPERSSSWLRTTMLVAHGAAAPLLQIAAIEPGGAERTPEGWDLDLPTVRVGRGGHVLVPARRVTVRPTENELICPVQALDDLVSADGHLWAPPFGGGEAKSEIAGQARARIRAAAVTAGLTAALDPYPGAGMTDQDLRRLVCFLDPTLLRFFAEQAYALWGCSGAFRGDELSRMRFCDLDWFSDGVVAYLSTAKGDQAGEGAVVYVPYGADPEVCPVRLLERWCHLAGIRDERVLFPTIDGRNVHWDRGMDVQAGRKAVRRFATRLGWKGRWATRSMRRGFAESADAAGEHLAKIAAAMRHTSINITRKYVAPAKATERAAMHTLKDLL